MHLEKSDEENNTSFPSRQPSNNLQRTTDLGSYHSSDSDSYLLTYLKLTTCQMYPGPNLSRVFYTQTRKRKARDLSRALRVINDLNQLLLPVARLQHIAKTTVDGH